MLNGYTIHGIDIEQLCRRALNDYTRNANAQIPRDDYDDYLADLFLVIVKLEKKYNPNAGVRFDQYAYPILRLRCIDTVRRTTGRTKWQFSGHTYERERPTIISLDAHAHHGGTDDDRPLVETIPDQHSHLQADPHTDDDRRLLTTSLRHQNRDNHHLRQTAAQHAQARARNKRAA